MSEKNKKITRKFNVLIGQRILSTIFAIFSVLFFLMTINVFSTTPFNINVAIFSFAITIIIFLSVSLKLNKINTIKTINLYLLLSMLVVCFFCINNAVLYTYCHRGPFGKPLDDLISNEKCLPLIIENLFYIGFFLSTTIFSFANFLFSFQKNDKNKDIKQGKLRILILTILLVALILINRLYLYSI